MAPRSSKTALKTLRNPLIVNSDHRFPARHTGHLGRRYRRTSTLGQIAIADPVPLISIEPRQHPIIDTGLAKIRPQTGKLRMKFREINNAKLLPIGLIQLDAHNITDPRRTLISSRNRVSIRTAVNINRKYVPITTFKQKSLSPHKIPCQ